MIVVLQIDAGIYEKVHGLSRASKVKRRATTVIQHMHAGTRAQQDAHRNEVIACGRLVECRLHRVGKANVVDARAPTYLPPKLCMLAVMHRAYERSRVASPRLHRSGGTARPPAPKAVS